MAAGLLLHGCAVTALLDDPITARAGRSGLVVAAPHATDDTGTGPIAEAIAQRTGFGLVIARGAAMEAAGRGRPAEAAYRRQVRAAAQGPLDVYAEIHGSDRPETAARIEIATAGVDRELALRLRALAELVRDAHLRAHPEVVRLDIAVEPADPVFAAAADAGRDGSLTLARLGLHIALPRAARLELTGVYTAVLADFLLQAVLLPRGR
ncbi:MAG TPA: hypothetical protein VMR23_16265 [Candidatus Limnocylindria bacterium]|nr:hypothetical protein [Candidatus Limnocylindria bacterium]